MPTTLQKGLWLEIKTSTIIWLKTIYQHLGEGGGSKRTLQPSCVQQSWRTSAGGQSVRSEEENNEKQAGAELCQAQIKLSLTAS
jgi:hypothetical protein